MTLYLFATTSMYILLFYPILSSIAQRYIQSFVSIIIIIILFIYICVFFLFSSYFYCLCRCCLCELEAYDTKINSLYAQAYLAIKAHSDSEESV